MTADNKPLDDVQIEIPVSEKAPSINITSTFYFKKIDGILKQRFDVVILSHETKNSDGKLKIAAGNKEYNFDLKNIKFGQSRHSIYLPELIKDVEAECELQINGNKIKNSIKLQHQKHYELHLALLAHTDIGYTNPQPIVKEIHVNNIDSVLSLCDKYPDFSWTIETVWQMEQYENSRPHKMFMKLINYIKEGRIAVSPVYSNPFTGRISEEEMIQSVALAEKYKREYGIKFNAAVFDDVPGESWFLPEVLKNIGVTFLANGINEVYNNYNLQRNLPKAFNWEAPDGSKITSYINEAYNEGRSYGLEKGNTAVENRLWTKINKLKAKGYPYNMILLISAYMDNVGVATDQYLAAKKWNEEYAYPKFVIGNISEFAEKFNSKYENSLQVLKGDMTSPWDITSQGEPVRNKKTKWIQSQILSAQKLSALNWILDKKQIPLTPKIDKVYNSLLNFDGHGSGLEYGYGNPEENKITMDYRGEDVDDAFYNTEALLERSIYKLTKNEESFEGEGIYVFNTLSWKRSTPVEIQFPENQTQQYEVIDLTTNKVIPSFREGYKLFFVADSLPSFGFRKFRLQPTNKTKIETGYLQKSSDSSIENNFYKITFDKASGNITSIVDKKSDRKLINKFAALPFGIPIVERFQNQQKYKSVNFDNTEIKIIDESPVRIILRISWNDSLFKSSDYTLWRGLDKVDVNYKIDLTALKFPEKFEEYGIAFPFDLNAHKNIVELLGGFAEPSKDILPGVDTAAFSIRRSAAQFNDTQTISWSAVDNRVIRIRNIKGDSSGVLIPNIVNNFPKDWNRNEVNNEELTLRFSFTNQKGKFNPSFTSRFGWEENTIPIVRKSWYKSKPAEKSFLKISNENILLLNIVSQSKEDAMLLRLQNVNNTKSESAEITSDLFSAAKAAVSNYFGGDDSSLTLVNNSFKIKLKPNQVITVKLKYKEEKEAEFQNKEAKKGD